MRIKGILMGMSAMIAAGCVHAQLLPGINSITGNWDRVSWNGKPVAAGDDWDIVLHGDGVRLPSADQWRITGRTSSRNALTATRRGGDWELTDRYELSDGRIERSTAIRWHGSGTVTLRGVELRTPGWRLSDDPADYAQVPGDFPPQRIRFDQLRNGQRRSEQGWTRAEYNLALIRSRATQSTVMCSAIFTHDLPRLSLLEGAGRLRFSMFFDAAARLSTGQSVEVGRLVIVARRHPDRDLYRQVSLFSDTLGNGPAPHRTPVADRAVLYQAHPWGPLEIWSSGDFGARYPRIGRLTPYYSSLGVNILWLLPPNWQPPWVYTTPALKRVDPGNGTEQELRDMCTQLRWAGILPLTDMVLYGMLPSSDEIAGYPDAVWCRNERGEIEKAWGGTVQCADTRHPVWQAAQADAASYWAREFGFCGARLDCAGWGQVYNWASDRPNGAVAEGGLALNGVVRDAFRKIAPDSLLVPEAGRPVAFRHADMLFDYPFYLALRDMVTAPDRMEWIQQLRQWVAWEVAGYPSKAVSGLIRFTQNHDCVPPEQFFGIGPAQALHALSVFLPGTVMIHQEQETGYSDKLSLWCRVRNDVDCLTQGRLVTDGITADSQAVLAFGRVSSRDAAVVAVNLSAAPQTVHVSWRGALPRYRRLTDAFTGAPLERRAEGVQLTLEPWGVRVAHLSNAAPVVQPVYAPPALTPRPTVWTDDTQEEDDMRLITVTPAARWGLETAEGTVDEPMRDWAAPPPGERHPIDMLPVLRRYWTPLASGYLDGARTAAIRLTGADGAQRRLVIDPAHAERITLSDPAWDGALQVQVTPASALIRVEQAAPGGTLPPFVAEPVRIDGPVSLAVDPQTVTLASDSVRLVLARRRGGVPISLRHGTHELLTGRGMVYSDWGLWGKGQMISSEGATNPRLSTGADAATGAVWCEFRYPLQTASWNGVQFTGPANPRLDIRLRYTLTPDHRLQITLGAASAEPRTDVSAFLALRLPIDPVTSDGALPDAKGPGRVYEGVDHWNGTTAHGETLHVTAKGLQRLFLTGSGRQADGLFLALLDGDPIELPTHQERTAQVTLQWAAVK